MVFGVPLLASHFLLYYNQIAPNFLLVQGLIVFVVWLYCHRRYAALRDRRSIVEVQLRQDRFYLFERSGESHPALLMERSFVRPNLYLLYFKLTQEGNFNVSKLRKFSFQHYRFVFIFPYNSDNTEALRRLRMFVLHGKQAASSTLMPEPMD